MSALSHVSRLTRAHTTLLDVLKYQARTKGHRPAFTFRAEDGVERSLTFGQLDRRAQAVAVALQRAVSKGDPVLLVYPPGLDFIVGFFGCVYAGAVAVPATYPKASRPMPRLSAIARDCGAPLVLTTAQTISTLDLPRTAPDLAELRWVATDSVGELCTEEWDEPALVGDDLAFLQYTSGSTSCPKGVMISHANVLHNLETIRCGFAIECCEDEDSPGAGIFWLPAYHDMGLIGGVLEPLYAGGHSVLLSPAAFLQRPVRWLQAISDYRAVVSGGPNFAYELCVRKTRPEEWQGLDLSSWRVAFCGAEPIRSETLEQFAQTFAPCGFRAESFYPCYGLAEATLLVAGGRGPSRPVIRSVSRAGLLQQRAVPTTGTDPRQDQKLVGCGHSLNGQKILIVDAAHKTPAAPHRIGEIWIKGPDVARGYWNRAEENQETFGARLADSGEGPFLRTGDLGFVLDGHLYVTGRLKDLIIVRGRNHYPQDIEATAEKAHAALVPGCGAAFAVEVDGADQVVIVHEVSRHWRGNDLEDIFRRIRHDVAVEHELELEAIVLIRQASLPRTTSGKVQRALCRTQYLGGELKVVGQWVKSSAAAGGDGRPENGSANAEPPAGGNGSAGGDAGAPGAAEAGPQFRKVSHLAPLDFVPDGRRLDEPEINQLAKRIEAWLLEWMVQCAGVPRDDVDRQRPFAEYGLSSLAAVELSRELEDMLKVRLSPVLAWNYPTPAALAPYLARLAGDPEAAATEAASAEEGQGYRELEQLLAEVEQCDDRAAEAALQACRGRGAAGIAGPEP
jgi:acyl-CoA synthetase (AMP-forming)/AMP-acid ligase II/acyl carrier protein